MKFGAYVRKTREERLASGEPFSLRAVAKRIGVSPTYLSFIECDKEEPSEKLILALAAELGEDADVLFAMAGKVSPDLRKIICSHPKAFAALLRELRGRPEKAIVRMTTVVRDGDW